MNNIYHENDTNCRNITNENEKENGNGSNPEVSKRKFSKKKKEDYRKEITSRCNSNNGNNNYVTFIFFEIVFLKN